LAVVRANESGVTRSIVRASVRSNNVTTRSPSQPAACELCMREAERYTVHHLVPRSRGGRFGPKAKLCPTCHRQLHALFSETTLAKELHSIDLIRANSQMSEYLRWARRQKSPTTFRVRRAKERR
jgi:hypothetical protein